MAGNRDAQSHDQKDQNQIKNNCKQNSPRTVVGMDGTRCFGWPWSVIVGGGGVKSLPFCLGTAYNVCSMEDIGNSWLLC